jgi:hypothetical protein
MNEGGYCKCGTDSKYICSPIAIARCSSTLVANAMILPTKQATTQHYLSLCLYYLQPTVFKCLEGLRFRNYLSATVIAFLDFPYI